MRGVFPWGLWLDGWMMAVADVVDVREQWI